MKKSVASYPIGLLISVFIVVLIVYYGSMEINAFFELKSYQDFGQDILSISDSIDYLKGSNSKYGFVNAKIRLPEGQLVAFDNLTNQIILKGYYSKNISANADIVNYLEYFEPGQYSIVLCYYECSNDYNHDSVVFI